jgi:hypothetical protein
VREGVKTTAPTRRIGSRGTVARWACALWRALPGDLVGTAAIHLAGARHRREIDVTGWDDKLLCRAVVVEEARLGRWLDRMPLRPGAMTFGRYVLARRPLPDPILRHELEHVRQWALLGPLFLPAYLLESARARAAGADRYRGNRFEVAARAAEGGTPTADGDRSPPDALGSPQG